MFRIIQGIKGFRLYARICGCIEGTFATIRLRHRKTKGNGTPRTSLAMMFKLAQSAQKRWRCFSGHVQITHLLPGKQCVDGVLQDADGDTRREIIRTLVKQIEIGEDQVQITYRVGPSPFVNGPSRGQSS